LQVKHCFKIVIYFFWDLLLLLALPFIKRKRLFGKIPDARGKKTIWIHGVSLGEMKAFAPLYAPLRKKHPDAFFLISCMTDTALNEARRLFPEVHSCHLPIDLSWIVRKWVKALNPSHLLFMEGDLWPNLLKYGKKSGAKLALISGKLSFRSAKRFGFFPKLSTHFFSHLDLICAQSKEHYDRFLSFVPKSKLHLTGNLKWDQTPGKQATIPVTLPDLPIVAIASTHKGEEEFFLQELPLDDCFVVLAPRHPERFEEVATLLKNYRIAFCRWSELEKTGLIGKFLLLDAMGKLPSFFAISTLAIVAGSFVPKIGGHNLYEPCLYGAPVIFGPYAFSQKELAERLVQSGAGKEVQPQHLFNEVRDFLAHPSSQQHARGNVAKLVASAKGVGERTLTLLEKV